MEAALYSLVTGIAPLAAIVGDHIWWTDRLQATGFPSIVMTRVSGVRGYDLAGPDGLCESRVQFDCDSLTFLEVTQIRDALLAGISGFRGTVNSLEFKAIFFEVERHEFTDTPASDKLYRISLDALITHKEK